jgi:PBP1b-binding outer membrane lipoprotein LpoB
MMKSTWTRWGVCMLAVIAMIALLGGCAKKEKASETETTETTETAHTDTQAPAMAGTYTASMANGTASLMLNPDMTASFSMQPMADAPAQVENGTWVAGSMPNSVDVTFSRAVNDSTMSMTLNFAASGDSLALTNGESVGLTGLVLMKANDGHEGHQH